MGPLRLGFDLQLQSLSTKCWALCSCSLNFVILTYLFTCLFMHRKNVSFAPTSKVRRRFLQKKSLDQDPLKSLFEMEILPNYEWLTYLAPHIMSFFLSFFFPVHCRPLATGYCWNSELLVGELNNFYLNLT